MMTRTWTSACALRGGARNDEFCNTELLYPGAPTLCHCERLQINEVTVEADLATD
jgi:hypothetical protein